MTLYIGSKEITPSVTVSNGGSEPTGTLNIYANGLFNVANYATANVNVSGGGEPTNISAKIDFNKPINLSNNTKYLIVDKQIYSYSYEEDLLDPLFPGNQFYTAIIYDNPIWELGTEYETGYYCIFADPQTTNGSATYRINETNILLLLELGFNTNCGWASILTGTDWNMDWNNPVWQKPWSGVDTTYVVPVLLTNGLNTFRLQFGLDDVKPWSVYIKKVHKFNLLGYDAQ